MAEKRACSDSGMAEIGKGDDKRAVSTLRWKGRTHINFIAGLSRLRVLPVVIHLLPDDIEWFSEVMVQGTLSVSFPLGINGKSPFIFCVIPH